MAICRDKSIVFAAILLAAVFTFAGVSRGQAMSALIAQAMDNQLPSDIDFTGTLPDAITKLSDLTGVRIEADNAVFDALPWGDLTTFSAKIQHETLREAMGAICQKLGLEFELGSSAVELHPLPPLRRLGRRCTVEELQALDLLASTPLESADVHLSENDLIAAIDLKLQKSNYAIENRAFDRDDKTSISIARNATLLDALEEIPKQTGATWYPWGKTIVVVKKPEQIRMQLGKRISTRYTGQDISAVLLDLSERSGVDFQIEAGAILKILPQYRTIKLVLHNATIEQAMESICGFTGLGYAVTDDGVRLSFAGAPATAASTEPSN